MPQCIVPLDENGTGECGGRLNGFSIERPKQREIREVGPCTQKSLYLGSETRSALTSHLSAPRSQAPC